jgi:hypothetical protein
MRVPVQTQGGQQFFVEVTSAANSGASVEPAGDLGHDLGHDPNLGPATDVGAQGAADRVLNPTLFSKAVDVIRAVSHDVTSGLLDTNPRPSEVEIALGLGFDAGGNVWIFKGGAQANLKLVLRWKLP